MLCAVIQRATNIFPLKPSIDWFEKKIHSECRLRIAKSSALPFLSSLAHSLTPSCTLAFALSHHNSLLYFLSFSLSCNLAFENIFFREFAVCFAMCQRVQSFRTQYLPPFCIPNRVNVEMKMTALCFTPHSHQC